MEKNIFEGAKFGDKFVTRDGSIAIYYRKGMYHFVLVENEILDCRDNGTVIGYINYDKDIVSRYNEPINEDELDELSKNYATISTLNERDWKIAYDGYDAGYRKAMEGKV